MVEKYPFELFETAYRCADCAETALIEAEDVHRKALDLLFVVFGTDDLKEARRLYLRAK